MIEQPATKSALPRLLTIGIVIIVLGYGISFYQTAKLSATITQQIDDQQNVLITLAEQTANNTYAESVSAIVRDCSTQNRVRFDTLLGQLDAGLSQAELTELRALFDVCASYYADAKLAMAYSLQSQVAVLEDHIALLETLQLGSQAADTYSLEAWQMLSEQEFTQATKAGELVVAQREIIDLLLAGKTASSPEIVAILEQVNETKEAELYAKTQSVRLLQQITQ